MAGELQCHHSGPLEYLDGARGASDRFTIDEYLRAGRLAVEGDISPRRQHLQIELLQHVAPGHRYALLQRQVSCFFQDQLVWPR